MSSLAGKHCVEDYWTGSGLLHRKEADICRLDLLALRWLSSSPQLHCLPLDQL
jgi:hypothetical protein